MPLSDEFGSSSSPGGIGLALGGISANAVRSWAREELLPFEQGPQGFMHIPNAVIPELKRILAIEGRVTAPVLRSYRAELWRAAGREPPAEKDEG